MPTYLSLQEVKEYRKKFSVALRIPESWIWVKDEVENNIDLSEMIKYQLGIQCKKILWLSIQLGISQSTLSQVLHGKLGLRVDKIKKISTLLDIPIDISKLTPVKKQKDHYFICEKHQK